MFNHFKTAGLLAILTGFFVLVGFFFGGWTGIAIAVVFAGLMNFGAYWFSDKIVLRIYKAREVSASEAPELHAMVRTLADAARLPMPRVYIIPEATPNAFATGRNPHRAAVAVTEGIVKMLTPAELFGVLAHEIGHIKNRDTLVMTIAGGLAGAISMIVDIAMWTMIFAGFSGSDDDEEGATSPILGVIGLIVAPFAAMLIQMAISRSREFVADREGARLSGNPLALASALRKLEDYSRQVPIRAGNPATAHLFIVNPFSGRAAASLFSTHPRTELRVAKLEEMARQTNALDLSNSIRLKTATF